MIDLRGCGRVLTTKMCRKLWSQRDMAIANAAPSLWLDFVTDRNWTGGGKASSQVACTRASNGTYTTQDGQILTLSTNVPRLGWNDILDGAYAENYSDSSEDLATAHSQNQVTINVNTGVNSAGTLTSDKIVETAVTNYHSISKGLTLVSGVEYELSAELQQAGRTKVHLLFYDGSSYYGVLADLSTGTLSAPNVGGVLNGLASSSIESLPNDNYRVKITRAMVGTALQFQIRLYDGASDSYAGDVTKGVYATRIQVRRTSSQNTYLATTTRSRRLYSNGVEADTSNVIYSVNGTGGGSGLDAQAARTNLDLRSNDIGGTGWSFNGSFSATDIQMPDGSGTFKTHVITTTSPTFYRSGFSITSGQKYGRSIFVKHNTASPTKMYAVILFGNTAFTTYKGVIFDPENGVFTFASAGFTEGVHYGKIYHGDGIWRIWASQTATATVTSSAIDYRQTNVSNDLYGSSVPINGSGNHFGGSMFFNAGHPTDYIATVGTTVARSADALALNNFSSWFAGAASGIFLIDVTINQANEEQSIITLSDAGTGQNAYRVSVLGGSASAGTRVLTFRAGSSVSDIYSTPNTTVVGRRRIAFGFGGGLVKICHNGGTVVASSSITLPTGMTRLQLGEGGYLAAQDININEIIFLNREPSDALMQQLSRM